MFAESIMCSIEVGTGIDEVLGLCLDAAIAYAAFSSVVMMTGCGGSCGSPTTAYSWFYSRSEPGSSCGRSMISYASLETSYASAFFLEI